MIEYNEPYPVRDETNWSEMKIQSEALQYLFHKYPVLRRLLYHIPNEAERSVMERQALAAGGLTPGIQDLHFIWRGTLRCIEMKRPGEDVRPEQKCVHAAHARQGVTTWLFYNSKDLVNFVSDFVNWEPGAVNLFELYDKWNHFVSPFSDAGKFKDLVEDLRQINLAKYEKKRKR